MNADITNHLAHVRTDDLLRHAHHARLIRAARPQRNSRRDGHEHHATSPYGLLFRGVPFLATRQTFTRMLGLRRVAATKGDR
jgi:hypothetical protein